MELDENWGLIMLFSWKMFWCEFCQN